MDSRLFLPGWGAPAALCAPALPANWDVLDPPGSAPHNEELDLSGGHMWMLVDSSLLATAVSD